MAADAKAGAAEAAAEALQKKLAQSAETEQSLRQAAHSVHAHWSRAAAEGWSAANREARRRHAEQLASMSQSLSSPALWEQPGSAATGAAGGAPSIFASGPSTPVLRPSAPMHGTRTVPRCQLFTATPGTPAYGF